MKNRFFMLLPLMIVAAASNAEVTRILSPNGLTYVDVELKDGHLMYSAGYRQVAKSETTDVCLLESSPLGFVSNVGDFSKNLTLKKISDAKQEVYEYDLRQSKQSHVKVTYTHQDFALQNADERSFTVDFRVGDDNIAFRYEIPVSKGNPKCIVIERETTGFDFPAGTTTFVCPQAKPMSGWERTKPSYEEEYVLDQPVGTRSLNGQGYTFPCLFHEGERGWVLISETGVDGLYCASHLSDGTADGLYSIAFPMEGENNGFGSTGAQFGLPGKTPWRTITLGKTLKPIVETTVAWDVVDQLYEPSISYKGGRSTWSWIIWQDASINYDDQVTFIDLAAQLGWEYCLIDGGWLTNIGRERMETLFAYAKSKGVAPWVWYNSNGGWNDAPQCAKQCMYSPIVRKNEMKWLRDHGVKGIKVDFFAGDKQETIKLYEQIFSDANDYGIQCIFHGCTLPRGWERMYPNYCSSEAVLASENLYFSQHADEFEGQNACLHPFIRNTVGSMEFGGTVLQRRLHREPNKGNTRIVGDVFELGTAIAFQSSVQNFALTPRNLTENPDWEINFMRQVPTTWDETRFLDGYPGKYVALARRSGMRWYVTVLNGQKNTELKTTLDLSFLAGQTVTLLSDGKDGKSPSTQTVKLDKKGQLKVSLAAESGLVVY
ncbi:MAG: glycoside hydrolase family 97 catalytic domain-containing protein [Bacteroidaceae bacterium]|nr:glycoside hydrolase family 97 catalytic domain-containing protein [Bacteroidaceae bacterium]